MVDRPYKFVKDQMVRVWGAGGAVRNSHHACFRLRESLPNHSHQTCCKINL